jgi:hypothetical protein
MSEAYSAEVIELAAFRPKAGASPMALHLRERRARRAQRVADAPADETETCKTSACGSSAATNGTVPTRFGNTGRPRG